MVHQGAVWQVFDGKNFEKFALGVVKECVEVLVLDRQGVETSVGARANDYDMDLWGFELWEFLVEELQGGRVLCVQEFYEVGGLLFLCGFFGIPDQ